jgi:hypothetical protein
MMVVPEGFPVGTTPDREDVSADIMRYVETGALYAVATVSLWDASGQQCVGVAVTKIAGPLGADALAQVRTERDFSGDDSLLEWANYRANAEGAWAHDEHLFP